MSLAKTARDAASAETQRTLVYSVAYCAAMLLSIQLRIATGASVIWLANGVMASGLMLVDRRMRAPFVALCAAGAMVVAETLTHTLGLRFFLYLAINVAESVAMAALAWRLCGPRLDFSRWPQLGLFSLIVIPLCMLAAALGVVVMGALGQDRLQAALFFQSHALGAMLVIPAVTILSRPRRYRIFAFGRTELFVVMCAFSVLALAIFAFDESAPILFLLFPMMMILAFRYGPVGASLGLLAVGLLSVNFSLIEPTVLSEAAGLDRFSRIQLLQAFMAVLFFTALPVAGAVATSGRMRLLLARRTLIARNARQKAERATQARGEFLANMSHEIRTPLNGVLGLADALWRTDLKADQREMLKMILASGKALTGLLSDALDLARADSGNMEIAREPFDIRQLIEEAAFPFEHLAGAKGLNFETVFEGEIPRASVGDPLRIRQILSNLISNAIKFTAAGGVRLTVACETGADGGRVLRLSVRDTGIGLAPEMQARLFRRFEQGDSSVTRRYGGCGLGLSIAHKLAGMMGGELDFVSEAGRGSTFSLTLPVVAAERAPEAAPAPADPASLAAERRLCVLLAEDHPVNQKVVQIIPGDRVELTIVDDGQAAVEAVRTNAFHVVLMDTHMPVMDGLTAIRAIRDWETANRQPRTPIVSLTADAMPHQVDAALAAGADLHLSKPITGDSLVRTLHESQTLRPAPGAAAKAG
jgi:signal transduction histidine kinase/CheY-like chemotaxis protein